MRKVNYFLFACLLGFGALFVGCGGNDETVPPTIEFLFGATDNHVDGVVTLAAGVTTYKVQATVSSETKLSAVTVSKKVGADSQQIHNVPSPTAPYTLSYEVTGITEDCVIIVKATNDGSEASKELTIKVTAPAVPDFEGATGNVTVATGETVYYKQGDKVGKIVITEASATAVKLTLDDKTEVAILDDAGKSYLKKDGTTYDMAGATADQANFLLAKKKAEAMLCTGNSEELGTKFPNATPVVFTKKTKTE